MHYGTYKCIQYKTVDYIADFYMKCFCQFSIIVSALNMAAMNFDCDIIAYANINCKLRNVIFESLYLIELISY